MKFFLSGFNLNNCRSQWWSGFLRFIAMANLIHLLQDFNPGYRIVDQIFYERLCGFPWFINFGHKTFAKYIWKLVEFLIIFTGNLLYILVFWYLLPYSLCVLMEWWKLITGVFFPHCGLCMDLWATCVFLVYHMK